MNERYIPTTDKIAFERNRLLWNVSKKGVIFVGQTDPEEAQGEVKRFEALLPLFYRDAVLPEYIMRRDGHSFKLNRDGRIDVLQCVLNDKVKEHFKPEENPANADAVYMTQHSLGQIIKELKKKGLHPGVKDPDPFVTDLTGGEKIDVKVEGEVKEMEVQAPCPAAGIARKLYWDFNDIVGDSEYEILDATPQVIQK